MPTAIPPQQPDPATDHQDQAHRRPLHRVNPTSRASRHARIGSIRLGQPRTVPLTDKQHRQAVTALEAMIASWWHTHQPSKHHTTQPDYNRATTKQHHANPD